MIICRLRAGASEWRYLLTDDGYTIAILEMSGLQARYAKTPRLSLMTVNGFGGKYVDSELQVTATSQNFARQKHNLLQAMLAVNDLFYLAHFHFRVYSTKMSLLGWTSLESAISPM